MNVLINHLELSAELAHQATVKELIDSGVINNAEDVWLENGENYTKVAQEIFNEYYDEYFELINNIKIDE